MLPLLRDLSGDRPWPTLQQVQRQVKREYVQQTLAASAGSISRSAALAGVLRESMYEIVKNAGIAVPDRARAIKIVRGIRESRKAEAKLRDSQ